MCSKYSDWINLKCKNVMIFVLCGWEDRYQGQKFRKSSFYEMMHRGALFSIEAF